MTNLALGPVTPQTQACAEAIAAKFPAVPVIGGYRPGTFGYHRTGQALDVMTYSDRALGDAIAAWSITNRGVFGISEIIWWQRIITSRRLSEGWRMMDDRGGITVNHMDHVHLSIFDAASGGTPTNGSPLGTGSVPPMLEGSWGPEVAQTIDGDDEGDPNVRFGGAGRRGIWLG